MLTMHSYDAWREGLPTLEELQWDADNRFRKETDQAWNNYNPYEDDLFQSETGATP